VTLNTHVESISKTKLSNDCTVEIICNLYIAELHVAKLKSRNPDNVREGHFNYANALTENNPTIGLINFILWCGFPLGYIMNFAFQGNGLCTCYLPGLHLDVSSILRHICNLNNRGTSSVVAMLIGGL